MDAISELLATRAAIDKLGARDIFVDEAQQLLHNRYVIVRNTARRRRPERELARRLLIGQTDGGRVLSLVVERTSEPTTWILVTGWPATEPERKLLSDLR